MEFIFLSLFFAANTRNSVIRKIVPLTAIPFIAFCIYDFLKTSTPTFAFLPLVVECLTLLIVLLFILYEKMSFSLDVPIYQTSFFWIAVAFIIYFAGNFFLFLFSSSNSFDDPIFRKQYAIIYSFVTILKNVLLCVGIITKENQTTKPNFGPIGYDFSSNNPF